MRQLIRELLSNVSQDADLLRLIESSGKRWKQIAAALKPFDRTPAMVRNRYLRIKRGRWLTEQGRSKNRCGICGELKRGHVCKSTPQGLSTPKVLTPDDEDAQSNSSSTVMDTAATPNKRSRDDDVEDDAEGEEAEEEENAAPTPMHPSNVVNDPSPSIANLPCATATVACEPLPPAAPSPNPQVAGVKKLAKLERQGSLEVLAVAASLVANPMSR